MIHKEEERRKEAKEVRDEGHEVLFWLVCPFFFFLLFILLFRVFWELWVGRFASGLSKLKKGKEK